MFESVFKHSKCKLNLQLHLFIKCGSILPSEINHFKDRRGVGGVDPKMMVKKKKELEVI